MEIAMTVPTTYGRAVRFFVLASLALILGGFIRPAQAQKMVFAHYMVTNQDYRGDSDPTGEAKIAAYEREIQQAQAVGIDGFALNVGGWLNQTYYIRYSSEIFEAAARLNSGFKLMFSADMCCGNAMRDVEDMVRRFANDPRYGAVYFKFNGKVVLTTFSGENMGTGFWNQVKTDLATGSNPSTTTEPTALAEVAGAPSNAPVDIFLVPAFFWGGELPGAASVSQGFSQWSSTIDGSFYWGIAGVPGSGGPLDQIPSSESYASVVHGGGKLYLAPICLQFWGANANRYYEYSGAAGMRAMWMDAINVTHPEWVEIVTWNDFIEGSYVSPIDDPNKYQFANFLDTTGVQSSTLGYFHSHNGATALLAYFIKWYKTGLQPTLSSDSIYWFYRTQSMSQNAGVPTVSPSTSYGPVADVIYVTANLAQPATLIVTSGSKVSTFNLPAGSTDVQAPFAVGTTPTFEVDRNGVPSIALVSGTDAISTTPRFNDYYYSTGSAGGGQVTGPPPPPPPPPTPPSVPTGLKATGGANAVTLSWAASTGTAPITYRIFRGTSPGGEGATAIASGIGSTSFTDVGLATGTTYYYKVAASNSASTTDLSGESFAKTLSPFIQLDSGGGGVPPFAADAGFSASNVFSSSATIDTSAAISPAPQAVYQSVRWAPSFTYTMGSLTPGATYLVRLHFAELSFNGTGQRVFNVALNGTNVLSNFDLFAAAGAQNKAVIKEFNTTATAAGQIAIAFTRGTADNPEVAGIQVFGTAGGSTPAPVPATPTGLAATAGTGQISLSWSASAGATSYNVYRSTTSNGEGMTAVDTGLTSTSFTDSGLTSGTTYFYKVAAVNNSGTSAQSAEASATVSGSKTPGLPDLVVTSISMAPANPKAGDHVVFTAVVLNQGTAATPVGTVVGVGFDLDGSAAASVWEDTDTASLAPGAAVTLTATGGTSGSNYWIATTGTHTVTAWVDDVNRIQESNKANNKLTETVFVSPAAALNPVAQLDTGSSGGAAPFSADADFNTGNMFSSTASIDLSGAANPAPMAVYQTCRWAPSFSYTIPALTAGARYTVRLHFAELTWTAAGQRRFNVAINGTNVLSAFDIFAAAGGRNKAITEQFTATANAAGQIVIGFSQGGADNPEINAIEVLR
jgi:glucan endo-1,3-alpha-glucosidase